MRINGRILLYQEAMCQQQQQFLELKEEEQTVEEDQIQKDQKT